jgi:hypothetical protein
LPHRAEISLVAPEKKLRALGNMAASIECFDSAILCRARANGERRNNASLISSAQHNAAEAA